MLVVVTVAPEVSVASTFTMASSLDSLVAVSSSVAVAVVAVPTASSWRVVIIVWASPVPSAASVTFPQLSHSFMSMQRRRSFSLIPFMDNLSKSIASPP